MKKIRSILETRTNKSLKPSCQDLSWSLRKKFPKRSPSLVQIRGEARDAAPQKLDGNTLVRLSGMPKSTIHHTFSIARRAGSWHPERQGSSGPVISLEAARSFSKVPALRASAHSTRVSPRARVFVHPCPCTYTCDPLSHTGDRRLKAGSNIRGMKMQSDKVPPIKFFAGKTVTWTECSSAAHFRFLPAPATRRRARYTADNLIPRSAREHPGISMIRRHERRSCAPRRLHALIPLFRVEAGGGTGERSEVRNWFRDKRVVQTWCGCQCKRSECSFIIMK